MEAWRLGDVVKKEGSLLNYLHKKWSHGCSLCLWEQTVHSRDLKQAACWRCCGIVHPSSYIPAAPHTSVGIRCPLCDCHPAATTAAAAGCGGGDDGGSAGAGCGGCVRMSRSHATKKERNKSTVFTSVFADQSSFWYFNCCYTWQEQTREGKIVITAALFYFYTEIKKQKKINLCSTTR